jgi:hypothetical protein
MLSRNRLNKTVGKNSGSSIQCNRGWSVINTIEQFGRNAGTIWETLSQHGPLSEKDLIKKTHLRGYELDIGIGWLARENKIYYDGSNYVLSDTNLEGSVGSNAGKIWQELYELEDINLKTLQQKLKFSEQEFFQAIGWLAREDKIQFDTTTR